MKDMKILLPGGAGLVGQNLVARLVAQGYGNIVVLDKHVANLEILRKVQPAVTVEYADLADAGPWQRHFAGAGAVVMLQAQIGGKTYDLKTYSYSNDWKKIEGVLLLLRDRTSGKTTYGGGRVVDIAIAKGSPPQEITFDLNTAYSFLCAHSDAFNCPLVLTNNVDVELKYGEKYPPLFSGGSAKR